MSLLLLSEQIVTPATPTTITAPSKHGIKAPQLWSTSPACVVTNVKMCSPEAVGQYRYHPAASCKTVPS